VGSSREMEEGPGKHWRGGAQRRFFLKVKMGRRGIGGGATKKITNKNEDEGQESSLKEGHKRPGKRRTKTEDNQKERVRLPHLVKLRKQQRKAPKAPEKT